MTFEQMVLAVVLTVATTIATTLVGAWASKKWGKGTLAEEVDEQGERLIDRLTARLTIAEGDAKKASERADAAERQATETEGRRQRCEEEIGRLKRDLRATERELLSLYRKIGEPAPGTLVKRHADHQREAAE